jgi:peroxiredoxin Q/BCP
MKPELNQPLPSFSLPSISFRGAQGDISPATLAGKPFVLFVYPRDNTPGCTVEVCQFRDLYLQFREIGVEVLGLSRDGVKSHQNFIKKQEVPYALICDEKREVIGAWGLIYEAKMYGKPVTKVARTTYFVDDSGIVRQIWEDVAPPGHAAQVLEFAREFVAA